MRRCVPVRHPATLAMLIATLLLNALCALAGTLQPVKLRVHGREVALKTLAVTDGKEVYLPLDALTALKATYVVTRREETVIVTPASAGSVEIALARPGRELMVPFSALNKQLKLPMEVRDGICDVDAPARKLEPKTVQIAASPPPPIIQAKPVVNSPKANPSAAKDGTFQSAGGIDSRQRTAETDRSTQKLRVASTSKGASGSLTATTIKISSPTAPLPQNVRDLQPAQSPEAHGVVLAANSQPVRERGLIDDELELNLPRSGSQEALNPSAKPQFNSPKPAVDIQAVTFEAMDERSARIRIKTSTKAVVASRLLRAPTRLSIDFPHAAITAEQREFMVEHPFASAMHLVEGDNTGTSRLVIDLAQLVGYNVDEDAEGVTVNLMTPRGVGKSLKGLVVVIDAGHGGPDQTGCSAVVDGVRVYEKNITLMIAKRLQRLLTECGVDVIMTRTSDCEVGLDSRPALANRNNADLFISIHVDDCGIPNSASGTTAYYHMDDASSHALAHSLAERIGRVSGLPVRGAWSDRKRFPQSGMAVLRGSRVPASLVEVGYINNNRDRAKLVTAEFQQTVAQAIFDGIKGYVHGDLPDGPATDAGAY